MTAERPAAAGEVCMCGRRAVVVFVHDDGRETGWCGLSDGGDRSGPCPFCGGPRHEIGPCPEYRLAGVTRPAHTDGDGR